MIWKLLRQHISIAQFAGFALANLFGMLILMLGYQMYRDVEPVFTSGDSFLRTDYLILSKKVGAAGAFGGGDNRFSASELNELSSQPFVNNLGKFTSTEYKVMARMDINGSEVLSSELFFESVPDKFVDLPASKWHYDAGSLEVPILLPRSYMAMYNFGFAQSRQLPKLSEGLVGMINFNLFVAANGYSDHYHGKVIGFSSRLNTILVPQSFIEYTNNRYAPNTASLPNRLILDVANAADNNVANYLSQHGYEAEDNNLATEKTTYFLRLMVSVVVGVGIIISLLSFYILMLSVFLLVQKNTTKLENLLLIGYSPQQVALPYQLLTIGLGVVVFVLAFAILAFVRTYYMDILISLFPDIPDGNMLPALVCGLSLLVFVSLFNIMAIRGKIVKIWKRKE